MRGCEMGLSSEKYGDKLEKGEGEGDEGTCRQQVHNAGTEMTRRDDEKAHEKEKTRGKLCD